MGGGKGTIYDLQYFLKPGSIIFEVYNIPLNILLPIFQIINNKIPIKIRLLSIN